MPRSPEVEKLEKRFWALLDGVVEEANPALKELLAEVWSEGYMRGEFDTEQAEQCAKRGGPTGGCDCQVRSTNPYEDS